MYVLRDLGYLTTDIVVEMDDTSNRDLLVGWVRSFWKSKTDTVLDCSNYYFAKIDYNIAKVYSYQIFMGSAQNQIYLH